MTTDPADIDLDSIVTDDELEPLKETVESLEDEISNLDFDHDHEFDPEEFDGVEPEDAQEIADRTFMSRLDHLLTEDCDTEVCNHMRDALGVEVESDDPEADGDGAEGGAESEPDPTDPPAETSNGGGGDDGAEGDGEGEGMPENDGPANAAFPDEF